jgi:hypothetical protein
VSDDERATTQYLGVGTLRFGRAVSPVNASYRRSIASLGA